MHELSVQSNAIAGELSAASSVSNGIAAQLNRSSGSGATDAASRVSGATASAGLAARVRELAHSVASTTLMSDNAAEDFPTMWSWQ